ncbi:choice-of-anchor L domain-containing protein, partial [Aureisphaera galaxeae]|uniref:choice-of-anchor L domain-containing protein n=1 Tax=Aureisphaera galaxeae TaxID=1538023 RepID=UPI00234FBC9D
MKKLLLPLVLLFNGIVFSQITVDDTTYNVEQLVNDVLISGSCTQATDITTPNNSQDSGEGFNSFGFFNRGTSNFPFEEGVVMLSGDIQAVPLGPIAQGSNPPWAGDPQLDLISGGNTNNATEIVFNFVPIVPTLTFNYLLASEEYETGAQFPCTFADVFAFILTGPGIPNVNDYDHDGNPGTPDLTLDLGGKNIALLPGTNIPAAITNIHDEGPCAAGTLGEFAFPEFYDSVGGGMGDTGFNGRTVVLTAQEDVIPGETYTIKLVVADFLDSTLDTAVFIEAGSFDIGSVDLGVDLTVPDGNARCEGQPYTIVPDLDAPGGTTFEWFFEDPPGSGTFVPFVPAETGPTLTISTTGTYQLVADLGGVCTAEGTVFIEFAPPITVNMTPAPLVKCDPDNDGITDFMLTDADADLTLGDPDLAVSYHGTFIDADLDQLPLPDPYTNDDPYNDSVWARVYSLTSSCYEIVELILEVRDSPVATVPSEPLRLCDEDGTQDG